jgi:hypothetical protein
MEKRPVKARHEILANLKEFKAWSNSGPPGADISPIDFVGFVATPELFFGFAELFCPALVERNGGVFLAAGFSDEILGAWLAKGISVIEAQRVMNHVHISTLIQNQSISDELAVEIAEHLAQIWNLTLAPYAAVGERVGVGFADAAATFYVRVPTDHDSNEEAYRRAS